MADDPNWKPFIDGISYGGPEPLFTDYKGLQNTMIAMVQSVVTGKAEPAAALKKAAGDSSSSSRPASSHRRRALRGGDELHPRPVNTVSAPYTGRRPHFMSELVLKDLRKSFGDVEIIKGVEPRRDGRRVRRLRRPVRLRQVDAAAHDRRPGGRHRGRHHHRRQGGQRTCRR